MDKLYQNRYMNTKRQHPLKTLTIALLSYWIITFIIMFYMESKHPGGEQFLLRIFVVGLNYFPLWGIIVSISLIFLHKEWALKMVYIINCNTIVYIFIHYFLVVYSLSTIITIAIRMRCLKSVKRIK